MSTKALIGKGFSTAKKHPDGLQGLIRHLLATIGYPKLIKELHWPIPLTRKDSR